MPELWLRSNKNTFAHSLSLVPCSARHRTWFTIPQAKVDWEAVQAHVRQVQETIRGGTLEQARAGIAAQGIDLFMGQAMFTSPHEILVNGEILRGKRFLIATGTVALIPDIEGLAETGYITNVEAVSLPELPKRLVVIGAGPIGLEFAQMFSRLGAQVVVLEHGKQPLPREDPDSRCCYVRSLLRKASDWNLAPRCAAGRSMSTANISTSMAKKARKKIFSRSTFGGSWAATRVGRTQS